MSRLRLAHDWYSQPLPANVLLGARSWIYSAYAFLHYRSERRCGLRLGDDSGVYAGSFFELGPEGSVVIGRFCTLVGAIVRSEGRVSIGDRTFVAHEVVMSDDGVAVPPGSRRRLARPRRRGLSLGSDVWVGARAVLLGGVRVGDAAIVGAGALVDRDVPAGALAVGNPLRILPGRAGPVRAGGARARSSGGAR